MLLNSTTDEAASKNQEYSSNKSKEFQSETWQMLNHKNTMSGKVLFGLVVAELMEWNKKL